MIGREKRREGKEKREKEEKGTEKGNLLARGHEKSLEHDMQMKIKKLFNHRSHCSRLSLKRTR